MLSTFAIPFSRSSEREREGLDAWIEKLDLERSIDNRLRLSDQLMKALFADSAVALIVDVDAVRCAGRLSVDAQSHAHGGSASSGSHDEMKIARVKAVRDAPAGRVQRNRLLADCPITGKRPMIEL